MELYYCHVAGGNFGDDLNEWVWARFLPEILHDKPAGYLLGIGTILNTELFARRPLAAGRRKLVIGSGVGYGRVPQTLVEDKAWDIRCVRGPRSAEVLGLPAEKGVIDPAVLLSDLPEFQDVASAYPVSFVPHWETANSGIWQWVCAQAGIHYINPCADSKAVIRQIAGSERVVAESLHAAIIADALRIPWVAVSSWPGINRFKWEDWTESLAMPYHPLPLCLSCRSEAQHKQQPFWGMRFKSQPPPAAANAFQPAAPAPANPLEDWMKSQLARPAVRSLGRAADATPQLSRDDNLQARKDRLYEILESVKTDYGLI